jgi:CCR4-NOT transcription complex subunit 11
VDTLPAIAKILTMALQFFHQLWDALAEIDKERTSQPNIMFDPHQSILESYRKCVARQLLMMMTRPPQDLEAGPVSVAWGAHSLLQTTTTVAAVQNSEVGRKVGRRRTRLSLITGQELSIRQRLGCLLVIEAICGMYGGQQDKAESPLFPLLVENTLKSIQQLTQDGPPNMAAEGFLDPAILEKLVESFLPNMLGNPEHQKFIDELLAGKGCSKETMTSLEGAVQKYTTSVVYNDKNYIPPLIVAKEDNELAELKRLLEQKEKEHEKTKGNDHENEVPEILPLKPESLMRHPLPPLEPPFARPMPPPMIPLFGFESEEEPLTEDEKTDLLEVLHAELIWLTPNNLRLMLIPEDEDKEDQEAREVQFRKVLQLMKTQAFAKPLTPSDHRMVLEMLNSDMVNKEDEEEDDDEEEEEEDDDDVIPSRLIQESGLNPQNLPQLVEQNPLIAHECLLRVLPSEEEDVKNEYLSALVGMDMSLHSMEVVNRLAMHNVSPDDDDEDDDDEEEPILHPEYISLFITSCIASCENMQDKHAQNRMVRLVCVFIQSLLRNKVVLVEVRAEELRVVFFYFAKKFISFSWPFLCHVTSGYLLRGSVLLCRVFADS